MIKYIKQLNRQLEIHSKNIEVLNTTLNNYLDNLLLDALTTLDARIKTTSKKYKYHKLVPIYISKSLILIPTSNKRKLDNIYINLESIKSVNSDNTKTIIKFYDNEVLDINISYLKFQDLIKRARAIKPIN